MTRAQTIAALRAKRQVISLTWAAGDKTNAGRYWRATDRMMRLTCAIDTALVRLGAEV